MKPTLLTVFVAVVLFSAPSWALPFFFNWGGPGGPPTEAPLGPCGTSLIPIDSELNDTVDAELGQVTWQVSVLTKKMGSTWGHTCGGVLVGKQAVLTAASCVDGSFMNAGFVRIEGAIVNLPKGGFVRRRRAAFPGLMDPGMSYTEKIVKHPDYNKATGENNLAILRLATALDFGKAAGNLNLVCDPTEPLGAEDLGELFVSGWGNILPKGNQLRGVLQLKKIETIECPVWRNDNEFCAVQEGECEGDLGGPVFTANSDGTGSQLIGITSRGTACNEDSPMLYTEVYPYLAWIKDASNPY